MTVVGRGLGRAAHHRDVGIRREIGLAHAHPEIRRVDPTRLAAERDESAGITVAESAACSGVPPAIASTSPRTSSCFTSVRDSSARYSS
ncbi:hypothetical protein DB32_006917 [Sandaracinus amylolyticus]|uniref:Uncharacterized protein n=1 Tax=Sandaracinus amylolyticus TaxID=927083 RepID=A0A0F6W7X4_9BACT|nr:hypothetical protein DB32_006917 [Sandaracinus amylolyticus]